MKHLKAALQNFSNHYRDRLDNLHHRTLEDSEISEYHYFDAPRLKPENGPRIFYHGEPTTDVIVLTHGLSDSPFYLEAIARRFFRENCNVVMPLLPAHGLRNPDKAMEDEHLDRKWKASIDNAVQTAGFLGERVSLGGFSTGGALSLNKILRDSAAIKGGLFLFSGALSVGDLAETAGRLSFIQTITRIVDGKIPGFGQDPYKYPVLPRFAGIELTQIIHENERLQHGKKIAAPVFATHSVHDTTAKIEGVLEFMEKHVEVGVTMVIAQNVRHACLPLSTDIPLDLDREPAPLYKPVANPQFDWVADGMMRFFREMVVG